MTPDALSASSRDGFHPSPTRGTSRGARTVALGRGASTSRASPVPQDMPSLGGESGFALVRLSCAGGNRSRHDREGFRVQFTFERIPVLSANLGRWQGDSDSKEHMHS